MTIARVRKHPLSLPNASGALGMSAGDRVVYEIDGRHGVADEFLHSGEAFISFDDGTFGTVNWNHLVPELPSPQQKEAAQGEGDDG